jgi:acyl-CoA dehydrogenase
MRGTRSLGFTLEATAGAEQVLPDSFGNIATRTMIPTSHVLWASLWLGIADDAVARARAFVRAESRRTPGTVPFSALRLADAVATLGSLRATVHDGAAEFERRERDPDALDDFGFAIRMNSLKTVAARMAPEIVTQALAICGIAGYRCDTPYSLGRHLRDVLSAALMVNNDRILAANANLLLVHKGD